MKKMKKITLIMFCLLFIFIGKISYAAEDVDKESEDVDIDLDFTSSVNIDIGKDEKTTELTLSIGNVVGVPAGSSIGYEATIEYDKEIFEDLTIQELNNWDVTYEKTTGILICELVGESITTNMQIAKFTLTLKEEAKVGETTVKLGGGEENPIITVQNDDEENSINFEKTCEKIATINIIETKVEEEPKDEQKDEQKEEPKDEQKDEQIPQETQQTPTIQETPVVTQSKSTQTPQNSTNVDNTTANTKMPATGVKTIFIILVIIVVFGGIYLIKYKSIELK